jgi:uncharacterized protein DUF4375
VPDLKWLDRFAGQGVDELLSLEDEYRKDSLVLAFEFALDAKSTRIGADRLSPTELVILAVEALEREVNNGGYRLFFENSSRRYSPLIVRGLERIKCFETAKITQRAIDALHLPELTVGAIEVAIGVANRDRDEELNRCDELYYSSREDIAGRLFAFIRANKSEISFK